MWAANMSRHIVDVPSEVGETSVAVMAKAIPTAPSYPFHSLVMISSHVTSKLLSLISQMHRSYIS